MKNLDEFKNWLNLLKGEQDPDYLPFVWELMNSPYVEYHYSLLKDKELDKEFRFDLQNRFDEHKQAAQSLLLSKLESNEDTELFGDIITMLGTLNDRENLIDRSKVIYYARKLSQSTDDYIREKSIIVLGWIGSEKEFNLLADILLNDQNSKCRAWAASSFMQLSFRHDDINFQLPLTYLYEAINQERDIFTLGVIIEAIQVLTKKRFGLSKKAIDALDQDKIISAKNKILKFYSNQFKSNE